MPTAHGEQPFQNLACRWHALAERRLAYYDELYRSGRWRHYYASQEAFAARMVDVIRATRIWADLAGQWLVTLEAQATEDRDDLRSAA